MIELRVDGQPVRVEDAPDTPLLWVLRDTLGVTGPKYGCGIGACGACTVLVDGRPTRACVLPIGELAAAEVTTVAGLAGREAEAVLAAWQSLDVVQCGFCQPGQVVAATGLLAGNPRPGDADIDLALAANLCRCATYARIRAAVHDAARRLEA